MRSQSQYFAPIIDNFASIDNLNGRCFVRIFRPISVNQIESRYIAKIVNPGGSFFVKVSGLIF
jgi:hypothetical protein